mgnify:FL=1
MAKNISWVTTRKEAIEEFVEHNLPTVEQEYEQDGEQDTVARREAWHNFVDWLHSNYQVSDWQVNNWTIPTVCG